ncbi:MAG TPA: ABC transporter substrate-binding protein [Kofleriaceae bacterium]|jgi:branched-chain amino acid transport system substrate-binding protein|nr:ABC transporter substrate-binding protein [Kofleriaceae bacterium]
MRSKSARKRSDLVPSRRQVLQGGLAAAGLAAASPLIAACKSKSSGTSGKSQLKIGFVSPRTGPTAGFGEPDGYVLELARKALAGGLAIGGTTYEVQLIDKDSQSNPQRSAQVANELITGDGVDLMLTTSTPETVNPVSDACEAAGVPCISTVVPWEAWYFGRGGKPGAPSPFKFTYHFCFGVEQFANAYTHLWPQVETNKKVGVMWPNDADGNAIRGALGPLLTKAGYTIVDPGAYADGTNDYSSMIAQFKSEQCEIFNTFPIPPDFATFWQQAAQQSYKPKIAQIAKTGLFPSQVESLGEIGVNLAGGCYWSPAWPYKSPLTGVSSQELGDGYQKATGKQWNQQLGASLALFDAAAAALRATGNPKDKAALAKALATLEVDTPVGHLAWGKGPFANVVTTPIVGGQWVATQPGSKYKLDFVICESSSDPKVPVAAKLHAYA